MRKGDRRLILEQRQSFQEFIREQREDFRAFMREERLIAARRHEQQVAELRAYEKAMREHFAKQDRKIDEIVAEGKAGRAALFAILDRLDNGGAAAAG